MKQGKKVFFVKLLLFVVVSFWISGIIIPLGFTEFPALKIFIPFCKTTYSHVCHQIPQKSFECNGFHLFVCARCFGIYTGCFLISAAGLFFGLKAKPDLKTLLLFSAPMLADVVMTSCAVYAYNKILSAATGLLFGSIVFVYILNIVLEIYLTDYKKDLV